MPTANTKVLSARIDKGKYYSLLERAAARKMPLNAYINVLFDEILSLKKEVVQKAEKGAIIEQTIDVMTFDGYKGFVATKDGIGGRWQMRKVINEIKEDWEFSAPLKESNGIVLYVSDRVDLGWLDCPIFYKNGWKVIERGKGVRDIKTNLIKLEIK